MDKREGSKLQGRQAGSRDSVNAGRNRLHRLVACLKCIPETVRWTLRDVCRQSRRCRNKKLVLAADCLGRQELLLLFRERKRRRNAKGSKASGEAGRETSSSFGASAGCRREGNRPALADSRCTHQNPFRMLKRVDDTCFGKPYGWHRIHHENGATSLQNPFWHYETHI
jgi:hypothetical protein